MPNLELNDNKDDIECKYTDHITDLILKDFIKYEILILNLKPINIDNQKYKCEVEYLLKYFNKIKHTYINRNLVFTIFNYFYCFIDFYFYQDSLFDLSIDLIDKSSPFDHIITRKEEFSDLEAPLNSSILSKTLEKGLLIKKLIFINTDNYYEIKHPVFHISFSANTLTIDWYKIDEYYHLKYLKILLELWPGLILRLKGLEKWGNKRLDWIQKLLIYCKRSPPCWKLSFSKVVTNIEIDEIVIEFFKYLNKLRHLYDSLSKIYDVELENITYEDLFINRTDYFKEFIGRQRDRYNNEKLKFERFLKYDRIERYLDDFFNK